MLIRPLNRQPGGERGLPRVHSTLTMRGTEVSAAGWGREAIAPTLCDDSPMDREARSELLSMMGLVAAVVAIVILIFFGIGFLFGRLFL